MPGLLIVPLLGFLVAQTVKNLPARQEPWVRSLGWEDSLEKGMATHSIILTWRIPWTEETLSSVPGLLIVPLLVPRTPPHSQLLPSPSCLLPGRVLLTFSSVYVSSALGSFSCLLPQFLLRGYLPSLAHLSRCTEVVFLLDCKLFEVRNR